MKSIQKLRSKRHRHAGDYGFCGRSALPLSSYETQSLNMKPIRWATTGDFQKAAYNHCGAVFVTNLALYFDQLGYKDLQVNDSMSDTFAVVHQIVGNGPVALLAGKAQTYFAGRGYLLKSRRVGTLRRLKLAIANQHPLGILLAQGWVDWHWILVVGWRQYSTGETYLRIVDGWHPTENRFYKVGGGAAWWSATEYWLEDMDMRVANNYDRRFHDSLEE